MAIVKNGNHRRKRKSHRLPLTESEAAIAAELWSNIQVATRFWARPYRIRDEAAIYDIATSAAMDLARFGSVETARDYLCEVVKRRAIDMIRKKTSRRYMRDDSATVFLADLYVPSPLSIAATWSQYHEVREELEMLPGPLSATAKAWYGGPWEPLRRLDEIGEILGVSRSRAHQLRNQVKACLLDKE